MAITLEQAKNLVKGDYVYSDLGTKWKVNGNVKIWKRDPSRVRVPVRHGLYSYAYIDQNSLHLVNIIEEE